MSTNKICYIFAAGDCFDFSQSICDNDFIIAADAGYNHTKKFNIIPHFIIGDFDSLRGKPENAKTIVYPSKKDYTDTHLAINYAVENGFKDIYVYGALGGERLDHTIANIQLCAFFAEKNVSVTMTDGKTFINSVHNGEISFCASNSGYISIFSMSEKSTGVTIKGLKYEIADATLDCTFPLGVSNEFMHAESYIKVENGTLLLVTTKETNNEKDNAI